MSAQKSALSRRGEVLLCCLCEDGDSDPVIICRACLDPHQIRMTCRNPTCGQMYTMNLREAREMFEDTIPRLASALRPGWVIIFPAGCPRCLVSESEDSHGPMYRLFVPDHQSGDLRH